MCQTQMHWDVWSKKKMMTNWNERWKEATTVACNETISNLEIQRKILELAFNVDNIIMEGASNATSAKATFTVGGVDVITAVEA